MRSGALLPDQFLLRQRYEAKFQELGSAFHARHSLPSVATTLRVQPQDSLKARASLVPAAIGERRRSKSLAVIYLMPHQKNIIKRLDTVSHHS